MNDKVERKGRGKGKSLILLKGLRKTGEKT